jgi:hypothetical protein
MPFTARKEAAYASMTGRSVNTTACHARSSTLRNDHFNGSVANLHRSLMTEIEARSMILGV